MSAFSFVLVIRDNCEVQPLSELRFSGSTGEAPLAPQASAGARLGGGGLCLPSEEARWRLGFTPSGQRHTSPILGPSCRDPTRAQKVRGVIIHPEPHHPREGTFGGKSRVQSCGNDPVLFENRWVKRDESQTTSGKKCHRAWRKIWEMEKGRDT